jgi:tetratricopeptide (TPR) repeat protein
MIKIILFIVLGLFLSLKTFADQNSPKLEGLFEDLYNVEDISLQNVIVGEIWNEWMKIDDPEIEKIMNSIPYFFQTQKYNEAIEALDYVIEINPNYSEGYNKRATLFFMMGEYEKSMQDIEATLLLEPRHFGALDGMSRILIYFGKYNQALQVYDEMKKLMPNDVTLDMKIDRLNNMIFDDA